MAVDSVYSFLGNRYIMPSGSIIEIGPQEGMNAITIKILSSGGTLEIGGANTDVLQFVGFTAIAGSITNSTSIGQTFGVLYPLSANEIYAGNLSGKIRLYASATCTVGIAVGRSQGY